MAGLGSDKLNSVNSGRFQIIINWFNSNGVIVIVMAPEWRSGLRHSILVLEVSLQTLVRF